MGKNVRSKRNCMKTAWRLFKCEWYVLMILKPFLKNFEIQTSTSSQIGYDSESDVYILRLPHVEEKVSPCIYFYS